MFRIVFMIHLVGLALGFGALLCHLLLLGWFQKSELSGERTGSERMSDRLLTLIQKPGVYLLLVSGLGLLWIQDWTSAAQGWLHFKLLFVFWVLLATRLMSNNIRNILSLREQCGEADSERLASLKANHQVIGLITVTTFIFILILSIWKPF